MASFHKGKETLRPIAEVFRHRNYALFMGGLGPFATSSWMQRVGVGWLTWELTHSTVWLGIIAAADLIPLLVLSPIAGVITDRVTPVKELRLMQWMQFLHAAVLAVLTIAGMINIHILLALTLYLGVIYAFSSAARHATVPYTVPRELVPTAVSLDSALFQASRFVGPAIAALIIPLYGVEGTFIAHAVGTAFFSSLMHLMDVPAPPRDHGKRRNMFSDINDSVQYIRAHTGIWPLLVLLTIASIALRPVQDMLPGFADKVFRSDATGLAWLTSAMGVGAMVSATRIALRGRVGGLTNTCFFGFFATCVATVGFVATDLLAIGIIFAALAGYALNTLSTAVQALIQVAVDDGMRARVMSLYTLIFRGTPAIGAIAGGIAANYIGLRWTFAIATALCLLPALAFLSRRAAIAESLETPRADN